MKKAIVIPSYRAEKTLASVLSRIPKEFWQEGVAIIVNDKSPDNTGEVAESLKAAVVRASRYPSRTQSRLRWGTENGPETRARSGCGRLRHRAL